MPMRALSQLAIHALRVAESAYADAIRGASEARDEVRRLVQADAGIPVGVEVRLERVDGALVIRWDDPSPSLTEAANNK